MLLSEVIIDKMQEYPHLVDMSDDVYKNKHEKQKDFSLIASEINETYDLDSNPKNKLTGDSVHKLWSKLWGKFKEWVRNGKKFKTGDGAKKKDPDTECLMERMLVFEPFVIDLRANVLSTMGKLQSQSKSGSVWQFCPTQETEIGGTGARETKVPPVSKQCLSRGERNQQFFENFQKMSQNFSDITEKMNQMLKEPETAKQPTPQTPQDLVRASYMKIVNQFSYPLSQEKRDECLTEMLS